MNDARQKPWRTVPNDPGYLDLIPVEAYDQSPEGTGHIEADAETRDEDQYVGFTVYFCHTCPFCGQRDERSVLTLNNRDFDRWTSGVHVQDAFPYLTADQREMLITGIHPECWDATFKEGD